MTPEEKNALGSTRPTADGDTPGVPGFRTWRGVYLFVFGTFVVYVVLLTVLTRAFQ